MNRKGFTLVELLATITILGLIVLIVVPAVSKNVTKSKEKSYENLEKNIITVTKRYLLENSNLLPDENETIKKIELEFLINENLFDTDKLINPLTNEKLDGYVEIKYNINNEEYKYTFKQKNAEIIDISKAYVTHYADIDGNGTPDGIIFADHLTGNTGDGEWTNSDGEYSVPRISSNELKSYTITNEAYNGIFGTKPVVAYDGTSTGSDRFYVLSLTNLNSDDRNTWYNSAYGNMNDYETYTSTDFGSGLDNTNKMISKWNNSGYGEKNP